MLTYQNTLVTVGSRKGVGRLSLRERMGRHFRHMVRMESVMNVYQNENGETVADVAASVQPAVVTVPAGKPVPATKHYTLRLIDSFAAGRNNFICVMVDCPKKPDCIAEKNWPLYGMIGKPTVTVGQFMKDERVIGGTNRARASLLWDIQRGYITIVDQNGKPV